MQRLRLIFITVITLIILTGLASTSTITWEENIDSSVSRAEDLLRLHVVANSDSVLDQRIKRRVRDRVIEETESLLAGVEDQSKAKQLITHKSDYIKGIAKSELNKFDKDYSVEVELGNFEFPKRTYGDLTLSAGNYEALRVSLGRGQGENWWCVLFPPFCYIDSNHNHKQDLEKVDEEELEIKMKSRVAEYVEDNPQLAEQKENLVELLRVSITDFNSLVDNIIKDD
ncbi:stage II sporulation protein R [Fuchsiella alkaliacetigena]|uniref:stage II sporulation protein R n=1 Tax=Fuchsiella alkaliacetigena TaxID=957042 RepID=UPI00200AC967|nr:stage II sporulation protein R [Fuchsiella alkaliacetigena]MCK8823709.1 stage II sporulation protein R [Fuchsiella alkaliacetigena]